MPNAILKMKNQMTFGIFRCNEAIARTILTRMELGEVWKEAKKHRQKDIIPPTNVASSAIEIVWPRASHSPMALEKFGGYKSFTAKSIKLSSLKKI